MTFNPHTLDIPMARKVLEHLIAHPEEHDQTCYGRRTACGTTMCIAGAVVAMDADTQLTWLTEGLLDLEVEVDGQALLYIQDRAAQLLGLDEATAEGLFHNYNNASALGRLGDFITQAEIAQATP